MPILKRLAVWLLERLAEAFLLGALLGALTVLSFANLIRLLPGVWVLPLAVGTVLFLHGYYVTTALFGIVWRSQRWWLYPAITATLFVIHTYIIFFRLKPDLSSSGRAIELPFEAGGASIVFACTFVGGWFLGKWLHLAPRSIHIEE